KQLAAGEAREEERPTNPRNYCAGSLKQKDPNITKQRKLAFMVHGCYGKLPGSDGKSEVANLKQLEKLGFETTFFMHVKTPDKVQDAVSGIEAERKALPYEIDGVVFTVNRIALHQELGSTSHHPRYRLAFKFSRDRGETTIKRILWHTTRSGRVSPAMEVAPISLGGATVTLCTLHNAKTVKETKVHVGDKVLLEREVIPYFVQKVSGSDAEADLPKKCDSCGSEVTWDETQTNLVCPNLGGCPSQLHDYLSYYVSRGVTYMMGVGERLIARLIEVGLLKSPVDFYVLTEEQILEKLERQGETSARNIVNSINSRREQTLETFLVSLGIRGLGPSVAARLVNHFGTLSAIQQATAEQLMEVEGIAETMAETIRSGLQQRSKLVADLLKHVTLKESEKVDGHLKESFCLTGHVEFDFEGKHYDARPDIEALIKSKGGTIKSVSKKLDYLVVGEGGGGKREKAEKAGVKCIDASQLVKLLEGEAKGE
ncbi:MAG TPA: helix-hairpin-helix domain-containing protein, partial [Planctomycetota bacterium]|nr:helix-hairpin-helix domain-containing protein [Planctomycetota bacterium]